MTWRTGSELLDDTVTGCDIVCDIDTRRSSLLARRPRSEGGLAVSVAASRDWRRRSDVAEACLCLLFLFTEPIHEFSTLIRLGGRSWSAGRPT